MDIKALAQWASKSLEDMKNSPQQYLGTKFKEVAIVVAYFKNIIDRASQIELMDRKRDGYVADLQEYLDQLRTKFSLVPPGSRKPSTAESILPKKEKRNEQLHEGKQKSEESEAVV